MIHFTKGDIFSVDTDALVNPVNCVGVMGKGLALEFKKRFPKNFDAYKKACESNLLVPGTMLVYETGVDTSPRYVINFPTKLHWKNPSRLVYVESGLVSLRDEIRRLCLRSIALPALGCGLGGLDWELVKPSIEIILDDVDCDVFVFESD